MSVTVQSLLKKAPMSNRIVSRLPVPGELVIDLGAGLVLVLEAPWLLPVW